MRGRLNLAVRQGDERQTYDYYQQAPLRVFFPKAHPDDFREVVLANTSGGLVGGDELAINVEVGCGASVTVTSQAAEKAYRSLGPDIRVDVNLDVKTEARLWWVPQATILFDGVRLRRRISVDVEGVGSALIGEILVFGRIAMGEKLTYGLVHDEWRIRHNDRLIWADSLHLTGDIQRQLASPSGFNGSRAMATLVYTCEDAPDLIYWAKDAIKTQDCWSGATLIGNVIIMRWLGRDAAALQQAYIDFVCALRARVEESEMVIPRLWTA